MNGRPVKGRKPTKKEATIKEKLLRSKLLNVAQNEGIYYQTTLRLIYRISQTSYRQNFYLKGGALMYAHEKFAARPTLDIDFLGNKFRIW